jgi:ligand-binding SRPBCC domain-containing protein
MTVHLLTTSLTLPLERDAVFPFFADAANLGRITPPELSFRILTPGPIAMRPGVLIDYRIGLHGIPMTWRTEITSWNPNTEFTDTQLKGPYAEWVHRHTFISVPGGVRMDDEVRYRLPFGVFGDLVHPIVKRQLTRIFTFRNQEVARLLLGERAAQASFSPVVIS